MLLLEKQKILSEIKIIKYYLIFVEINFVEWYNIEKVNMINKEVRIMNENLDRKILGENIKKRRIELGLTQKKLASNLGVSNVSLSQYETGDVNIPLATLNELANILETTVGKLIGTKEEIEYTTDRQTLLNKAIKNTNTLAIAVEKGIDKVENIFAPILKNSLDDIVILDIDGKAYKETIDYKKIQNNNLIKKIHFNEWRDIQNDMFFNPFENINFHSSIEDIENITTILLGNTKDEKYDFLISIIANFYFTTRLKNKKAVYRYEFDEKSLGDVYNFLLNNNDMISKFKEMREVDYLEFGELKTLIKYNKSIKETKENNLTGFKIPEYYFKLTKLIGLGNEKLNKIRIELLNELYFLDNHIHSFSKNKEIQKFCDENKIPTKQGKFLLAHNIIPKKLELNIFKNYYYYDDYLQQLAEDMVADSGLTKEEINLPKLRKTFYLIIHKEEFEELKPIIKMFFYFIFSQNETYNMEYENNRKDFVENNKNLLVIIDKYSELDLKFKDLSNRGIKQILVSDLDKIDKSYFKIENENMKVTEKKMEYLYKVEENGNIDFYKDTCPVSKPKKISIEDELRMFKNL